METKEKRLYWAIFDMTDKPVFLPSTVSSSKDEAQARLNFHGMNPDYFVIKRISITIEPE